MPTTAPRRSLSSFLAKNWTRIFYGALSILAFILIWWVVAWRLHDTGATLARFIPYPDDVARALVQSFYVKDSLFQVTMPTLIWNSLERIVVGFVVAFAIALPVGLLMGAFKMARDLGNPLVEMLRPIPPIAWVPFFLLAFRSFWGPVAVVFVGAFFPILLNVIFGVRSVDKVVIDAARTLGAKRTQLFTKVIIPSVIPHLMTGVKVGLGVAWMCIVAAELVPLQGSGLGNYIWTWADIGGQFDKVFAGMIMIGILSVLTTGVAELLERRVNRWMGTK